MVGKTERAIISLAAVALATGSSNAAEDPIKFAPKMFGNNELAVEVSGTLSGNGVAYPNNTHVVTCVKDRNECTVTAVEADGDHVTRVTGPAFYPIVKWTDYEIVAQEELPLFSCSRTTITIARKREMLLWVQEPANQTKPACLNSENRTLKWTIEDPVYWRRLRGK